MFSPILAYPNAHSLSWPRTPEESAFGAGLDFDMFLMVSCPDEKGKVILGTS